MKRYILAVTLLFVSCAIFASCGADVNITNAGISAVSGLSVVPANVSARLYVMGLNNTAEGSGTDSDGVPVVDTACGWAGDYVLANGPCNGDLAGNYLVYGDWINLAYDGCPGAAGTLRMVLLAWDTTGKYVLESRLQSEDWASWDSIGTIPAALCAIPTGVVSQNGGTTTVDVTWDNSNAGFYGSYAGAAPVSRLLTTFDVWFYQGVAPPASYVVPGAGWTAGTTGIATSTATTLGMTVPWTSGQTTYMTRRFYAEGSPLPTASTNYTIVATPSGAPVITSASAIRSGLNTNVTWTSADESKVTGYQVMWAPAGSSDFSAIGSFIQPAGNNHTYTSSVRIPATGSYVVKVGASLIDGTTEYSSPANVTATNVIKNKSRVTPN